MLLPRFIAALGAAALAALGAAAAVENFESQRPGEFWVAATSAGEWVAPPGSAEIHANRSRSGSQCLKILGGENRSAILRLPAPLARGGTLAFWAERWTVRPPFLFRVDARPAGGDWTELYKGDDVIKLGGFPNQVSIPLPPGTAEIRFRANTPSPPHAGVLIDDLEVTPAA